MCCFSYFQQRRHRLFCCFKIHEMDNLVWLWFIVVSSFLAVGNITAIYNRLHSPGSMSQCGRAEEQHNHAEHRSSGRRRSGPDVPAVHSHQRVSRLSARQVLCCHPGARQASEYCGSQDLHRWGPFLLTRRWKPPQQHVITNHSIKIIKSSMEQVHRLTEV